MAFRHLMSVTDCSEGSKFRLTHSRQTQQ